jgi:hypothetical protein
VACLSVCEIIILSSEILNMVLLDGNSLCHSDECFVLNPFVATIKLFVPSLM